MKLAAAAVTAFLLSSQSNGFSPSLKHASLTASNRGTAQSNRELSTALSMAFVAPEGGSNMFDGPTPLVKERDACGVGFIANTRDGGEFLIRWGRGALSFG